MFKIQYLFILIGFALLKPIQAQTNGNDSNTVFTAVESMPEFPGGNEAMSNYIIKNIKYPEIAKDNGIKGKVWVEFIIDKEGNVTNVQLKKGIGGGCDEEAIRVVKKMPQWKPGVQSGIPVSVKMNLPINFILQ